MDKEELKAKITEAMEMTRDLPEPYRGIAFEVILKEALNRETVSVSEKNSETPVPPVASMQANEFLASLHLSSQLDQFEAIAYHFLRTGQNSVTRVEVTETLSKARLSRPKNISDVIGKCIRRGHIIEATEPKDGQKAYQITPTGEKYIEEKIKSEVKQ